MARHRAILGLAFALFTASASRANDGPSKPSPSSGIVVVETDAKGRVKITRTKEGCEPTSITVATLDDGTVRLEMNEQMVATAKSFRFVVRDGNAWEIALSGHARMSVGQHNSIHADQLSFHFEDVPVAIEVPKAQPSRR